jgi:UDP-N-acetylglucosamine acyltransferase
VFPSAVIGAVPQDLKFHGEVTWTLIGDNNVLREFVTVHRGTFSKGQTVIGNNNLIMAYCHVAHDCVLHNHIIMSNTTQLAGEVEVDDFAIIGGGTLVHQFSHIGSHVMVQGGSRNNKDIPPYVIAAREPIAYCGVNSVGLNRRGFTPEQIHTIQEVYRLLYQGGMNTTQALDHIEATMPASPERDLIVAFVRASTRGVIRA